MAQFISNYIVVLSLLSANFNQLIASDVLQFPVVKHESSKKGSDDDDSVTFLVVGDWGRGGGFNQSKVANQMGEVGGKLDIDFVISTGDNFYDKGLKGTEDPFFRRSYTDIYTAESLQTPWYIVLGNHDYLGNTAAQLSPKLRKIDKRWRCMRNFVVTTGVADIFFVDTTPFVKQYFDNPKNQSFDWRGVLPRDQYMSYVRKNLDLALSKSSATWKIVVGHHTIKSIGHHGDSQDIVDQILPILEAHKVDMYINGHDHCLEHLSNKEGSMQFLTSGGGSKAWKNNINYGAHNNNTVHFYYDGQGFMSVKIKPEKAKIEFFDVLGKSLYRLKLK